MTVTRANPPENLMRIGTHLEKHFFERTELYDAILVNANVVEAFPAAIAGLLVRFAKPFIVDPITYGFAMPPTNLMRTVENEETGEKTKEPKKSFLKLGQAYLDVFFQRLSNRQPTLLADLRDGERIRELCTNVLAFQKNRLLLALSESGDDEYITFQTNEFRPRTLLAPYFYMQDLEDGWFELNLRLVEESVGANHSESIFAMICFEPEILDDEKEVARLVAAYSNLGCAGYFLWINNFEENRASQGRLLRLLHFIQSMQPKPVYNAYGGYLSQILAFWGMTGTCHGPGYGEHRDVRPVGGGVPSAQYYLKPLRKRLVYPEAETLVPESTGDFFARICNCKTCREIIDSDIGQFERFGETLSKVTADGKRYTYSTIDSITNCTYHYLNAKDEEFQQVRSAVERKAPSEISKSLRQDADLLEPGLGSVGVKHLRLWAELIDKNPLPSSD